MTERDEYTPSDASVRITFIYVEDGQSERLTREREAAFDRWLAAHDEAVRQEERAKAARIAESYEKYTIHPWLPRAIGRRISAQGKGQDR